MPYDNDSDVKDTDKQSKDKFSSFARETMLELVEVEDGRLVLRDINNTDDPLVTINFSDAVSDMLGNDMQFIGQHMIHAAVQAIMHKQFSQWHAHVYDEEPNNFS